MTSKSWLALLLIAAAGTIQADYQDDIRSAVGEIKQLSATDNLSASEKLDRFIELSYDYFMLTSPEFATFLGDPRGQGRWTDQSLDAIARRQQEASAFLQVLRGIERGELNPAQRLNYDLLLQNAEQQVDGFRFKSDYLVISQLGGPQQNLARMLTLMRVEKASDFDNVIGRMDAVPAAIDQSIALLREGMRAGVTPPKVTLRDVPQQIRNQLVDDADDSPMLTLFKQMPVSVDALQQKALRNKATASYQNRVAPAFEKLLQFMEQEYLPAARDSIAMRDLPDGEAWYGYRVKQMTTTDLKPEQIHQIGLGEVRRIRAEMEEIIESTGHDGDFQSFLEFLRTDPQFYHTTKEGLLQEYRDIAKRADPELMKLFGKLPRTPYGVIPVPAYAEKSQTTAYYQPGSLAAGRPGNFFANTYDLASRPRWEMEALTLHEAVPGHHLQIALQQELEDVPWFRQIPNYTAFVEGWGLYSESLGEEMGFYKDPYSKFGQLTYEMWRAVRLVVDTGMHHLGWSREKAIDYFKQNAGKKEHDIIVEIDRYIVIPGQALAYKIGELKIKELRAYAENALGDDFDIRAFHDQLLGQGAIPLTVLESNIKAWVEAQKSG